MNFPLHPFMPMDNTEERTYINNVDYTPHIRTRAKILALMEECAETNLSATQKAYHEILVDSMGPLTNFLQRGECVLLAYAADMNNAYFSSDHNAKEEEYIAALVLTTAGVRLATVPGEILPEDTTVGNVLWKNLHMAFLPPALEHQMAYEGSNTALTVLYYEGRSEFFKNEQHAALFPTFKLRNFRNIWFETMDAVCPSSAKLVTAPFIEKKTGDGDTGYTACGQYGVDEANILPQMNMALLLADGRIDADNPYEMEMMSRMIFQAKHGIVGSICREFDKHGAKALENMGSDWPGRTEPIFTIIGQPNIYAIYAVDHPELPYVEAHNQAGSRANTTILMGGTAYHEMDAAVFDRRAMVFVREESDNITIYKEPTLSLENVAVLDNIVYLRCINVDEKGNEEITGYAIRLSERAAQVFATLYQHLALSETDELLSAYENDMEEDDGEDSECCNGDCDDCECPNRFTDFCTRDEDDDDDEECAFVDEDDPYIGYPLAISKEDNGTYTGRVLEFEITVNESSLEHCIAAAKDLLEEQINDCAGPVCIDKEARTIELPAPYSAEELIDTFGPSEFDFFVTIVPAIDFDAIFGTTEE